MMFKPQKGKAFDNLPQKSLDTFETDSFIVSTKYDGNQIFITKQNGRVKMFTSDWKEFYIKVVAEEVHKIQGDFVIIGEFMHNCSGKLGDRVNSAKLTTYRTNFSKLLPNNNYEEQMTNIRVFDFLYYNGNTLEAQIPYIARISSAWNTTNSLHYLNPVPYTIMNGKEASIFAKSLVKDGWEGVMCANPKSTYCIGKRVNHSIKLKYRKTADLRCIAVEEGEGKYEGLIGALVLQDSKGRICNVGSGLSDFDRKCDSTLFLNSVIEIEYEQIIDTYIQPAFVCIREEKEID